MAEPDTVAVEHEIDREDVMRLIRIQESELDGLREFLDDILDICELLAGANDPVSSDEITRYTGIEELDEELRDWARSRDKRPEDLTKADAYAYLGIMERERYGYTLGPGIDRQDSE